MPNVTLDDVKKTKQKATVFRNLKKYKEAIDLFDVANGQAEELLATVGSDATKTRETQAEIADTYGMKGGTYRRWTNRDNNLDLALEQYRKGLAIEHVIKESTYNMSNVITLGISHERKPLDARALQDLDTVVKRLITETSGPRADEFWAWADLAQFALLRKDTQAARASYREALQRGPKADELKRHIDILRELAEGTSAFDKEMSDGITATITELERAQLR
jgi:tetratricopeptide (TPR) repeat protein